ncbi:MAG: hypothetical protein COT74_03265 [Bdellovibrionales bacterium CG10_big_fil_rev_8_21_14_0_10_45_34]|nr:MAG: hypothetical protein COT74_03265 [Bdellovibrionales bacterium CG10_big_fil_rev_8_21_14_0_10_45_34]
MDQLLSRFHSFLLQLHSDSRQLRKLHFGKLAVRLSSFKLLLLSLNVLVRIHFLGVVLGVVNRVRPAWSICFFCYAGSDRYSDRYCFKWSRKWLRWWPTPIAIFSSAGVQGLIFASPVTEAEFLDPANRTNLLLLKSRIDFLARLIGTKSVTYSGILPSVFKKIDASFRDSSQENVAQIVVESIRLVVRKHFLDFTPTVMVVGGLGRIGKSLVRKLSENYSEVITIDVGPGFGNLPSRLKGKPCLIVDVSRSGAIDTYVDKMWEGIVLVNETFPEPSIKTLKKLKAKGIPTYHISGVKGGVFPNLPLGYQGAIPCCAIGTSTAENAVPVIKDLLYEFE